MILKNLLDQAKAKKAAHIRLLQIESLELTPEEYMLVREDKNRLGLELMYSILEKIPDCGWTVDDSTFRFIRTSKSEMGRGFQRASFSIALTSGTKRFFIKAFRDYPELSEFDLIKFPTITLAINAINDEIDNIENRKIIAEERRRQEAILVEQQRQVVIARLEQEEVEAVKQELSEIRERLLLIKEVEKKSVEESNLQSIRINKILDDFCSNLSIEEHVIYLEMSELPQKEYQIIDDIPCRTTLDENKFLVTSISASHIKGCIDIRGILQEGACRCDYDVNSNVLGFSCSPTNNSILADVLKDFDGVSSSSRIVSIRFLKSVNLSTQLHKINVIIRDSMDKFLIVRSGVSVLDKSYIDVSDSDISLVIRERVEHYVENVNTIIWSANNSEIIEKNKFSEGSKGTHLNSSVEMSVRDDYLDHADTSSVRRELNTLSRAVDLPKVNLEKKFTDPNKSDDDIPY
ncbi:MAG: hypothetical protein HQ456_06765 [Polynucleobacter sp.]|nr:hypothetical protein [Polynucleobacter sp.]